MWGVACDFCHIAPSCAGSQNRGEVTCVVHLATARPPLGPVRVPWFKKAAETLDRIQRTAPELFPVGRLRAGPLQPRRQISARNLGHVKAQREQDWKSCPASTHDRYQSKEHSQLVGGWGFDRHHYWGHLKTSGSFLWLRNVCTVGTRQSKGGKKSKIIPFPSFPLGIAGNDK